MQGGSAGREDPIPVAAHATRTEFGRPGSSMRLRTSTAIAIPVTCASSVWERSALPITCLKRPIWASTSSRHLIQQGPDLRDIIDGPVGQGRGDDPAACLIHADVQFPPGSPLSRAVLFDQPFARPAQLQAATVHQQVERAAGRVPRRQGQRPGASAVCGVFGHRQIQAEQLQDRADQALGLPQRQPEHRTHRQRRRDRQVGIGGLPTWCGPRRRFPGRDRLCGEPDGQTAALPQRRVLFGRVGHASLRPRNMMATGGIGLVRHQETIGAAERLPSLSLQAPRCNTLPRAAPVRTSPPRTSS